MSKIQAALADVRRWLCSHLNDKDAGKVCGMLSIVSSESSALEAENVKLRQENERIRKTQDGWIKLPVDADGVAIHENDELWSDSGIWVRVKRFEYENGQWDVFVENKVGTGFYAISEEMHHYCPDTWESIIKDAREYRLNIDGSYLWKNKSNELVARCKALCEHTREGKE